jgi:hypothetical protein
LISASFSVFRGIFREKGCEFFCRMPIGCHAELVSASPDRKKGSRSACHAERKNLIQHLLLQVGI